MTDLQDKLTRWQKLRTSIYNQIESHRVSNADIEAYKQLTLEIVDDLHAQADSKERELDLLDNALASAQQRGLMYTDDSDNE